MAPLGRSRGGTIGAIINTLWNEFIDRYHYLGYKTLPGAQLRYFIKAEGQILALLGFGAAAWTTAPRDNYIGWDGPTRRKNLHLIADLVKHRPWPLHNMLILLYLT